MKTCSSCDFARPDKNIETGLFTCHRFPPLVFPVMQQNPITKQIVTMLQTIFPAVTRAMFCGEHSAKGEFVS